MLKNLETTNNFGDRPYFKHASVTWKITLMPEKPKSIEQIIKFSGNGRYEHNIIPEESSISPFKSVFVMIEEKV